MRGRSKSEFGGLSFQGLLYLLALGAAIYFGVMYVPIYFETYEIKSLLQEVGNTHWRTVDEGKIRADVLNRAKGMGARTDVPEGEEQTLDAIVVDPDNISVANDREAHLLTLQMSYTRYVRYPFLPKNTKVEFAPSFTVDTNPVKWAK